MALALATAGIALLLLGLISCRYAQQVEPPGTARRLSSKSGFLSNANEIRTFTWTKPTRTVLEAFQAAFPQANTFFAATFEEGYDGTGTYSWSHVVSWVDVELLKGLDPFDEYDGKVPIPWDATSEEGDQLAPGQYVGYSRRQVCYIVAKSLVGASLDGYDHGLKRFMFKKNRFGNCEAQSGEFGKSWWGLLTACAADSSLMGGSQGPMLIVAKGKAGVDPQTLLEMSESLPLADAGFQLCRYGDGGEGGGALPGVPEVPKTRCQPPDVWTHPGTDFMSVGEENGQAAQDMSGDQLGGNPYGTTCGIDGGQDQRLAVYMPEVSALTFFLSSNENKPQLGQPSWILGARMLFKGLDGTGRFSAQFQLDSKARLTSDLVEVSIGKRQVQISSSKPLAAFKSATFADTAEEGAVQAARKNRLPQQRNGGKLGKSTFRELVAHWHRGAALDSYAEDLHPLMKAVAKSIGAGPWSAGLSYGDSQLGMLAMWIGHAVAAQSWGGSGSIPLDYYLYSSYVENQGNQCFLHSSASCILCMSACQHHKPAAGTFWAPSTASMSWDKSNPCVFGGDEACSENGLETIMWTFGLKHAGPLWQAVEDVLERHYGSVSKSVFDLLMERELDMRMQGLKPPVTG